MHFPTRFTAACALTTCMIGFATALADAQSLQLRRSSWPQALIQVGHDAEVVPANKRFTGKVIAPGTPDPEGRIYSFQAMPYGPINDLQLSENNLQGWRMTVLSGKLRPRQFEVRANTVSEFTIEAVDGPLNGLASNDLFVIEDAPIVRSRRSDAGAGPKL